MRLYYMQELTRQHLIPAAECQPEDLYARNTGMLLLTDEQETAVRWQEAGGCVIGLDPGMESDPANAFFAGADAVAASCEILSEAFMRMIFCHHYHIPYVVGETGKLRIRESTMDDYPYIRRMLLGCMPEAFPAGLDAQKVSEREQFSSYIRAAYDFFGYGLWTVERREDGAVIGWCGLMPAMDEKLQDKGVFSGISLGYLIDECCRGKGYGREACEVICRYAFEELGVSEIGLETAASNRASVSLAKSLGFVTAVPDTEVSFTWNKQDDMIFMIRKETGMQCNAGQSGRREKMMRKPEELAQYIDHTLLKPQATSADIRKLCEEAKEYHFASICVNPAWIGLAAEILAGTDVTPCCVIAFPFGASTPEAKAFETADAVKNGAKEVDMVISIGLVKEGRWDLVKQDIEAVVKAAGGKAKVKVILETCLLTDEEKRRACQAAMEAGADFVKTSTGYSTGGATVEDIRLMRETVGADMGVKASGGIRTYEDCVKMLDAGASRIGASAGIRIVTGN